MKIKELKQLKFIIICQISLIIFISILFGNMYKVKESLKVRNNFHSEVNFDIKFNNLNMIPILDELKK